MTLTKLEHVYSEHKIEISKKFRVTKDQGTKESTILEIILALSSGQTDQTFHLTFQKQKFDEMLGLFDHLVWSHNICLAVLGKV